MAAPLAVRLLGPVEVLVDGRPADITGPKRQALVALLALRGGRVVTVDLLVEALWGDAQPVDPGNAVQHHVTRLRQALGAEALVAGPEGYALRGADVDVLRFEELLREARVALRGGDAEGAAQATAEALSLWRDRPLLGLPEAPWTTAESARLDDLRLDVLEERFAALLALGEHATLVSDLRAALEANAFRERLWEQLMLALYRAGRQAEALDAYRAARRVLSEELGLEPGPDLQRLQAAILAQDRRIAALPPARQRGNLPAAVTSFVGRTRALAEVQRLVREQRLLTLTGPPGVGKSRLALEAAHALAAEFGDGVWHVDLRPAGSAPDVARLLARSVEGGRSSANGRSLRRVAQRLRDAHVLLVLDECERFAGETGSVVASLLEHCDRVHVLATSREPLRVPGEHRFNVEPLSLSAGGARSEAVQLFVERARATRPGFDPSATELSLIGRICRLLDGLPAAIELAAGRAHALGPREILAGLEQRLAASPGRVLDSGAEGFLAALVDWSYDLLRADEKTLLHQLAVCRGGADRAALVSLSSRLGLDEATVTNLLATLHDKSIVTAAFPDGDARYDLLTIVRQHVLERLTESGDLDETKRGHALYFAAVADEAARGLRSREHGRWHLRLTRDSDNFWSALTYACESLDADLAQRLALGCAWYFVYSNRIQEGRTFVERALAVGDRDPSPRSVELLGHLTYFALVELDLETAVATGEEALEAAARVDAPRETAYAAGELAYALGIAGERRRAHRLLESARNAFAALGEDWYVAGADFIAAIVATRAGDVDAAAAHADALASPSRALEYDPWLPLAMLIQAWVAGRRGDRQAMERRHREVLESFAGDPWVSSVALADLAEDALASGDTETAQKLARRAVAQARHAHSGWLAAHARLVLARALAAAGDVLEAGRLYELVATWAEGERTHERIELFFAPLHGSPGAQALLALAELADEERAAALRERAWAVAAGDRVTLEPARDAGPHAAELLPT